MKKMRVTMIAVFTVIALILVVGCAKDVPDVTRTITVKGTAKVLEGNKAELVSGTFSVNDDKSLTLTKAGQDKIGSAEVGTLVDNVEFSITVVNVSNVKMVATEEEGYLFDEWEKKDGIPKDIEDAIDALFDAKPELERAKTLEIDSRLAEWLEPEFNRGYVVTSENVETMNQTIKDLKTEEITLIFKPEVLKKENLVKVLEGLSNLEELTVIGDLSVGVNLTDVGFKCIPESVKEFKMMNFKIPYSGTLSLSVPKMKFKNCEINTNMQIVEPATKLDEIEVEFSRCSLYANLSAHIKKTKLIIDKTESIRRIAFYSPVETVDCEIEIKNWTGDEWERYFFLYNPEVIKSATIEFKKYAPPFISHEGEPITDFSVLPETIKYRFTEGAEYTYTGEGK